MSQAALPLAFFCAAGLAFAQSPSTPRPSNFPPITAKDVRVLPFCGKEENMALHRERDFPDELRAVVTTNRVHILGRKRTSESNVRGTVIENSGKVALLQPAERFGTLFVKMPSVDRATGYHLVLEYSDGRFDHTSLRLEREKIYDWSIKATSDEYQLRVVQAGNVVAEKTVPKARLKAFGFGSTVRYRGLEADLTFIVGDGK